MAVNPQYRSFANVAKSCILSCVSQFDNKKKNWLSSNSFLSYKHLKLQLRVVLAGHSFCYGNLLVMEITMISSPMAGHLRYTNFVKVLIKRGSIHLSMYNCCKSAGSCCQPSYRKVILNQPSNCRRKLPIYFHGILIIYELILTGSSIVLQFQTCFMHQRKLPSEDSKEGT